MSLDVEVRDPAGHLLGAVAVQDARWLKLPAIRFARAANTRHFGRGLLAELPVQDQDLSLQVVEMPVGTFAVYPTVDSSGNYHRGTIDLVLRWDGPAIALDSIRGFTRR